jgi:hypothetical protein
LTDRDELAPAEEPELVRTLGMLERQRRRFVRDRSQAIQRLRADWTQHDPVAEAATIGCDTCHHHPLQHAINRFQLA